jgi:hypothetical protein
MVFIRFGNPEVSRTFGKELYYEDTVWGREPEAKAREAQLKRAGYYSEQTKYVRGDTTHYVVWSNQAHRKGTRNAHKRDRRAVKKEKELKK